MSASIDPRAHIGLLYREAQKLARSRALLGYTDPIDDGSRSHLSDGYFGLVRAAERFDPARGFKFTTLAVPYIRGAMLDALRTRLSHLGNRGRTMRRTFTDVTLRLDLIDHDPLPLSAMEWEDICTKVRAAVESALTPKERLVIRRRYWLGERLHTIASALRVSESRVSQILQVAHGKLFVALVGVVA